MITYQNGLARLRNFSSHFAPYLLSFLLAGCNDYKLMPTSPTPIVVDDNRPTDQPKEEPKPEPNPPAPAPRFSGTLIGAGDIADCRLGAIETAKILDQYPMAIVFTAGDNAYDSGRREEFRNCYEPTWGRHKLRTRPSPGNHDYITEKAAPYFEYFGPNAGPFGLGYYSYEIGEWHIISLNSNISFGNSAQLQWLRNDLASNKTKCAAAYWHHPRFSSGPNGNNAYTGEFWNILDEFGVDVVFNGHDHLYERFAPQDPFGRRKENGIRQFTAGTGGASLYQFRGAQPNSEARISAWGVLKLDLFSDGYSWQFISINGPADSGEGFCN